MKRNLLTTDALLQLLKGLRINTAERAIARTNESSQLDRTREGCAPPPPPHCRRIRASLPQVLPAARRRRTRLSPLRSCAKPSQS